MTLFRILTHMIPKFKPCINIFVVLVNGVVMTGIIIGKKCWNNNTLLNTQKILIITTPFDGPRPKN